MTWFGLKGLCALVQSSEELLINMMPYDHPMSGQKQEIQFMKSPEARKKKDLDEKEYFFSFLHESINK